MDDVDLDLFSLIQEFVGFRQSSEDEEEIEECKEETDDKRHLYTISEQSSSDSGSDDETDTEYSSEDSETSGALFVISRYIAEDRLDRADIACSHPIDDPSKEIYPDISRQPNDEITYQAREDRNKKNDFSSELIGDSSEDRRREKSEERI